MIAVEAPDGRLRPSPAAAELLEAARRLQWRRRDIATAFEVSIEVVDQWIAGTRKTPAEVAHQARKEAGLT